MEFDIKVNSPVVLSEDMPGVDLGCKVSGKNVRAYASLSENVLHLKIYGEKKCTAKIKVTIAGKEFPITVSIRPVKISANSLLLEKGKTKKLKVSGCADPITWSSSDKKIATVSKSGVVKGKKIGNVVITAKIGNKKIGCAVSVTTKKLKKYVREPLILEPTGNTARRNGHRRGIMTAAHWCGRHTKNVQGLLSEAIPIPGQPPRNLCGAGTITV